MGAGRADRVPLEILAGRPEGGRDVSVAASPYVRIIERILPRLSHINPAVVFSAIKLVLKMLDHIKDEDIVQGLHAKLSPSLSRLLVINNSAVTLLSWTQPEIKYVILKNIFHILQKRPDFLQNKIKQFFCSFNEPYYIKNEKLEILCRVCDSKNFEVVLTEIKLYITESDPNFVRKSIKVLCSIAIRFRESVNE